MSEVVFRQIRSRRSPQRGDAWNLRHPAYVQRQYQYQHLLQDLVDPTLRAQAHYVSTLVLSWHTPIIYSSCVEWIRAYTAYLSSQ